MSYPSDPELGWYYVVSVAGEVDGVRYEVGDWIVWNGMSWDKLSGHVTYLQLPAFPTDTIALTCDQVWYGVDISGVYGAKKHLVFLHVWTMGGGKVYFSDNTENLNVKMDVPDRGWVQVQTDSNGVWSYMAENVVDAAQYCILGVLTR